MNQNIEHLQMLYYLIDELDFDNELKLNFLNYIQDLVQYYYVHQIVDNVDKYIVYDHQTEYKRNEKIKIINEYILDEHLL
jgi:hypothetical protein